MCLSAKAGFAAMLLDFCSPGSHFDANGDFKKIA